MTMTTAFKPPVMAEAAPRPYHWTVDAYHRAWDAGVFGHEAKLELVFGHIIERFAEGGPTDHLWTADAFDRACDAGVFEEPSRVELIRGKVIARMGQGPLHSALAGYIADCLRAVMPKRLTIREEKPIRITFDGEPIPDLSVVTGANLDYKQRHPSPQDVALLVEVALSSQESDLNSEALLYAQAGIADYWVVLPDENTVVAHREPTAEGYRQVARLGEDDAVLPLAASDVSLPVRSLLGL